MFSLQGCHVDTRRVAVVDLGSNAVRLVLFQVRGDADVQVVDGLLEPLRLATQVGEPIPEAAINTACTWFAYAARWLSARNCVEVRAVATSAVREAPNAAEFLERVRRGSGIALEIIDGDSEARLGAEAVAERFMFEDAVVVDIGGGSVQLSQLRERSVIATQSWPIGAVRMTHEFLRSDPPTAKQVARLQAHVRSLVAPALESIPADTALVAMGGSARNLAEMAQRRKPDGIDALHGYPLPRRELQRQVRRLVSAPVSKRLKLDGLSPRRADVIGAASVTLLTIARLLDAGTIYISGSGIRNGLAHRAFGINAPENGQALRLRTLMSLSERYNVQASAGPIAEHNAGLLYEYLAPRLSPGVPEQHVVTSAALLHDVGRVVSYEGRFQHAFHLLRNVAMPGFSRRDQGLIALLVLLTRRGKLKRNGLSLLDRDDLKRVGTWLGAHRLAVELADCGARILRVEQSSDLLRLLVNEQVEVAPTTLRAVSEATGLWVTVVLGSQ